VSRGIIATVQFAATVLFAIPVGAFGILKLGEGSPLLGVVFLALAVGMVAFEELVTTPSDLPAALAQRVTGRVVKSPDDED